MRKRKGMRRFKSYRRERRKKNHRHTERGREFRGAAVFPLSGVGAFGVWPEVGLSERYLGKRRYGY